MLERPFKFKDEQESTPERALWCSIFLTFIEDMNHYLGLKAQVLSSDKKFFNLKNKNVDCSGIVTKQRYLDIIEMRIKQLFELANQKYIKSAFDTLDMDHPSFISRMRWQYENNAKINLSIFTERDHFQFQNREEEEYGYDDF
jgi:hypothetical protein